MHDVKELEYEWKRYKAKQRKPFYIIIFFIFFIFIILNQSKFDISTLSSYLNSLGKVDGNKKDKPNKIILNIGLDSLEKKLYVTIPNPLLEDTLVDIPVLSIGNKENIVLVKNENRAKVHLDIFGTSSISAYEDVEKRFLQSRDIDDALFLAKSYYKRLNYEKAVYWSYEVNKIDERLEESIFIFVKSKVKLGQKNEAILLLKRYLKNSSSFAGKILLDKIENDII